MPHRAKVDEFRRAYESYEDSALIHERDNWVEGTAQRIAAEQLLHEREVSREQRRHQESLEHSHHANKLAKAAIVIAVISLIVTTFQTVLQWPDLWKRILAP